MNFYITTVRPPKDALNLHARVTCQWLTLMQPFARDEAALRLKLLDKTLELTLIALPKQAQCAVTPMRKGDMSNQIDSFLSA